MQRLLKAGSPPSVAKDGKPLRFGMLGAARIGPNALILPARSHPDVVVAAVASRDGAKATKYANTYGIGKTYSGENCYQALIDDPTIDVVYIALPNGLHYEWTFKALLGGKHALVEKPIADTSSEAAALVALAEQKSLVLLEAIHYCFHPATQRVREIISSRELGDIKSIKGEFCIPSLLKSLFFLKDDVRFSYDLGGGSMMDLGVYPLSALRFFAGAEPTRVVSATSLGHPLDPGRVDRGMTATLDFPSSVIADIYVDFSMPGWGPFGIFPHLPKLSVTVFLEGGAVEFYGFPLPHGISSITVKPKRGTGRTEKVYRHPDGRGEEWWSSYRYQLEAFVDKVRGRKPQLWPSVQEPVNQLKVVEHIYEMAGLPPRPMSALFTSQ